MPPAGNGGGSDGLICSQRGISPPYSSKTVVYFTTAFPYDKSTGSEVNEMYVRKRLLTLRLLDRLRSAPNYGRQLELEIFGTK